MKIKWHNGLKNGASTLGGGSKDPNIFSEEIYNFQRIRLAPAFILIGFGIQVYAILKSPKKQK